MILTLKSTILFSASIAGALNVGQLLSYYEQREVALSPALAMVATAKAAPAVTQTTKNQATLTSAVVQQQPTPAPSVSSTVLEASATLAQAGLKTTYAQLYVDVQNNTGTPWQLLAAVHEVETGQSGSTDRTSSAGAVGPMQFMPATFDRYTAQGGNITNINDAMLAAGRYLAASGAKSGDYSEALFAYNHSYAYGNQVLAIANRLGL